jgi:ubiquitin-conjugating enzyme E2 T
MNQGRLKKEWAMWQSDALPSGICAWVEDESNMTHWKATLQGPKDTPYEEGLFTLDIMISERYPIEPPKLKFITRIYHPNIDDCGRICLDLLNMPPKGGWRPCINLMTLLTSVQLLIVEPNPDDPLMIDIVSNS